MLASKSYLEGVFYIGAYMVDLVCLIIFLPERERVVADLDH